MAPIQVAPEQGEVLTVTGTGLLTLTPPQREARILSITVEKVKLSSKIDYFNFRIPEPSSWWGYFQLVRNDTVEETIELLYRRQSILKVDHYELDPTEQLRCLIKDSTLLLFDNLTKIGIAAGLDGTPFGTDRANYILKNSQPRLVPTLSTTGLYYEIPEIYAAQISIIWQGYSLPCENLSGNQALPPPRSPAKGESGNNGGGGGGTRPAIPPPPTRNNDPNSDSPAPPPDSPAGPPSPTPTPPGPPTGNYRVTYEYLICGRVIGTNRYEVQSSGPLEQTGPGPFTLGSETQNGLDSIGLRDANGFYRAVLTGAISANNPCNFASEVRIISQVRLGP